MTKLCRFRRNNTLISVESGTCTAKFANAPFAYVMLDAGYPWAFFAISIGAITATASVILIQILGNSRTIYAMVVNKQLPAFLGELHPRFRTPYRGELIHGGLMAIAAFFLKRETVVVKDFSLRGYVLISYRGSRSPTVGRDNSSGT